MTMAHWLKRVAVAAGLFGWAGGGAQAGIFEWEVKNPFPLFPTEVVGASRQLPLEALRANRSLIDRYRRVLDAALARGDTYPLLTVEEALHDGRQKGWAAEHLMTTCWEVDSDRPRGAPGCEALIRPQSHVVDITWGDGKVHASATCRWLVAGQPQAAAPCGVPVSLTIPYRGAGQPGPEVQVRVEAADGTVQTETAAEPVTVEDLLVVAFGDSFASGEGNPDIPVEWSQRHHMSGFPARALAGLRGSREAQWLHRGCHRSLYSHQLRAALHLAMADRHRSVGFLGFACSGAVASDILDQWQKMKEGAKDRITGAKFNRPQIESALAILCMDGKLAADGKSCAALKREPDFIYLSIGGNDVGFTGLVAYAIVMNPLKNLGEEVFNAGIIDPQTALGYMEGLMTSYGKLKEAFGTHFKVKDGRVLLSGYPGPFNDATGAACASGTVGFEAPLREVIGDAIFYNRSRAVEVRDLAVAELGERMKGKAKELKWNFVDQHRAIFESHGWCASKAASCAATVNYKKTAADAVVRECLDLPTTNDGAYWQPYVPSQFAAYAPRTRWFRTFNDVKMIIDRKMSGAMHPSAEGHAAYAHAVYHKSVEVLGKE